MLIFRTKQDQEEGTQVTRAVGMRECTRKKKTLLVLSSARLMVAGPLSLLCAAVRSMLYSPCRRVLSLLSLLFFLIQLQEPDELGTVGELAEAPRYLAQGVLICCLLDPSGV